MRAICECAVALVTLLLALIDYEASTSARIAVLYYAAKVISVPYPGLVYFIPVFPMCSRRNLFPLTCTCKHICLQCPKVFNVQRL